VQIRKTEYTVTKVQNDQSEYIKSLVQSKEKDKTGNNDSKEIEDDILEINLNHIKIKDELLIKICNYLFQLTNNVEVENIYHYYIVSNYLELRQEDMKNVILNHLTNSDLKVFIGLLQIHQIDNKLFNIGEQLLNVYAIRDKFLELKKDPYLFNRYYSYFEHKFKNNTFKPKYCDFNWDAIPIEHKIDCNNCSVSECGIKSSIINH